MYCNKTVQAHTYYDLSYMPMMKMHREKTKRKYAEILKLAVTG